MLTAALARRGQSEQSCGIKAGGAVSRIFLTYAREDVDAAGELAEGIAHGGQEVWCDRHLNDGSRFTTEIDRTLKKAEAVTDG
jgi:hypothetical protein